MIGNVGQYLVAPSDNSGYSGQTEKLKDHYPIETWQFDLVSLGVVTNNSYLIFDALHSVEQFFGFYLQPLDVAFKPAQDFIALFSLMRKKIIKY